MLYSDMESALKTAKKEIDRLTAELAAVKEESAETCRMLLEDNHRIEVQLADARGLLDWITANTTLHKSVETGYYVDHYEANVLYDENLHQQNVGESIEDAIRAAIDKGKGE